nr:discoidin domain-containing protein [Paenibacillus castaneae]
MTKRLLSLFSVFVIAIGSISIQPAHSHAAAPPSISEATNSIFGPNVYVFDPSMPTTDIQAAADLVFNTQERAEFGNNRYALLFKPGTYDKLNVNVGFYTQVSGLGQNPDDVTINGGVNADAKWDNGNATRNFWRSIENLRINPLDLTKSPPVKGDAKFAVSQAAPMRRVHINGNLLLFDFDPSWNAGWASGGYIADSIIDGQIIPASQQQFFSRNDKYASWSNGVWNMMFVGDTNPPSGKFPTEPYTVIDKTPVMKEKPYLYVDSTGEYKVFVPSLQRDTKGVSWANGSTPGQSISIDQFYIAKPNTSSASDINNALNQGKNLIFTPGIYHMSETIQITRPDTVIMGLGYASIVPDNGQIAIKVADVDGVSISGLLFIAGQMKSSTLLEVGTAGSIKDHSTNPIVLSDLFFGIGGMSAGAADVGLQINSNDVIGDHFWIWRADHGAGAGWDTNVSKNGLVVNGNRVTIYGLFNEHHEEYQTLWNGEDGRLYFYQSEIPYDPQKQEDWMSHNGTVNGYASYKVADSVLTHEAWGLGIYSFFRDAAVKLENAMEVPKVEGVKIHHITTIWLNGVAGSEITHMINGTGGRVYANSPASAMRQTLTHYVSGDNEPPSVPSNLKATAVTSKQINLTWTESTDNVGVDGYDIYRNGTLVGSSTSATYSDSGLMAKTTYTYTIVAWDSSGNRSAHSDGSSATTQRELISYNQIGWTAEAPLRSTDAFKLIDGNTSTVWQTGTPMKPDPNQYFIIDMKEAKTISRVVINSPSNDYARGYELYASNDGTNWGDPIVSSDTNSAAVLTLDFDEAIKTRYIKVVQTGTSSSWWSVNEFSVYTDTEISLDRNGWTAITNPVNDNPANLFDGNMSTRWSSGAAMAPGQSIIIDMKHGQNFNKLVMDSGTSSDYARSYEIYVSNDGNDWGNAIVSQTATGPLVISDFVDQTARFIKIVQKGTNSSWWSIFEIYVYRDGTHAVPVTKITVSGTNGVSAITAKGGALQMTADVIPANAVDKTISWSVVNENGTATDKATISAGGLLTAIKDGVVKVIATANDSSGVTGEALITISGQHANVTAATLIGPEAVYQQQQFDLTVGVSSVLSSFTTLNVILNYDPSLLEFDTVTGSNGSLSLADSALSSLRNHFNVLGTAIKADKGQILIIMASEGNDNAISTIGDLLTVRAKTKAGAAAGETTVSLSDFNVSYAGTGTPVAGVSLSIQIKDVDKAELNAAIIAAQSKHDAATEGNNIGQYPNGSKAILQTAINSAKAVHDNAASTESEVADALNALNAAVTTFKNSVLTDPGIVDKAALSKAIAAAQSKHDAVTEGSKIGQYPAAARAALQAAITSAKAVLSSSAATQGQVNTATTNVNTALQTFLTKIVTLVPGQTSVTINDLSVISKYYGTKSTDANWKEIEAADMFNNGKIDIQVLAAVARMILDNWLLDN